MSATYVLGVLTCMPFWALLEINQTLKNNIESRKRETNDEQPPDQCPQVSAARFLHLRIWDFIRSIQRRDTRDYKKVWSETVAASSIWNWPTWAFFSPTCALYAGIWQQQVAAITSDVLLVRVVVRAIAARSNWEARSAPPHVWRGPFIRVRSCTVLPALGPPSAGTPDSAQLLSRLLTVLLLVESSSNGIRRFLVLRARDVWVQKSDTAQYSPPRSNLYVTDLRGFKTINGRLPSQNLQFFFLQHFSVRRPHRRRNRSAFFGFTTQISSKRCPLIIH